jgi:hypothetical protein
MARRQLTRETIAAAANKWSANYQSSTAAITAGINAPGVDPIGPAIANKQQMLSRFQDAVGPQGGLWETNLQRAGVQGWKQGIMTKGLARLSSGAQAGQPHYLAFLNAWAPAVQAQVNALPPRGTYQTNKQRATMMMDWEQAQRGKFRKLWRGG